MRNEKLKVLLECLNIGWSSIFDSILEKIKDIFYHKLKAMKIATYRYHMLEIVRFVKEVSS